MFIWSLWGEYINVDDVQRFMVLESKPEGKGFSVLASSLFYETIKEDGVAETQLHVLDHEIIRCDTEKQAEQKLKLLIGMINENEYDEDLLYR